MNVKQWLRLFALSLVFPWAASVCAQVSPQDHAEHHPDQKAGQKPSAPDAKPFPSPKPESPMGISPPSASPMTGASPAPGRMTGTPSSPAGPAPDGVGGMMEKMMQGMGEMMRGMGSPPAKELYPTLMDLPKLPPEKRAEIERLAHDRMTASREQMSAAAKRLSDAASRFANCCGDVNVVSWETLTPGSRRGADSSLADSLPIALPAYFVPS